MNELAALAALTTRHLGQIRAGTLLRRAGAHGEGFEVLAIRYDGMARDYRVRVRDLDTGAERTLLLASLERSYVRWT